jgi:hypothetical protein
MAFQFVSTAWQRQSLTASSTARNFAAISPEKCCEKVSLEGSVANKDFGISQKYAAYENWFTPHILWLREPEFQRTWLELHTDGGPNLANRNDLILLVLMALQSFDTQTGSSADDG